MKKLTPFLLFGILFLLPFAICTPNAFAASYLECSCFCPDSNTCDDRSNWELGLYPEYFACRDGSGPTCNPDPGPTDPTDPDPTDPTDPGPTDPTDPGPTDPTDPDPTDPTDPDPTDPGPTDPGPTDPEPTDPPGPTDEQRAAAEEALRAMQETLSRTQAAAILKNLVISLADELDSAEIALLLHQANIKVEEERARQAREAAARHSDEMMLFPPMVGDFVELQVEEEEGRRNDIEGENKNAQGPTGGDPVILASGFEDYRVQDLSYKDIRTNIEIIRRYRSNLKETLGSLGYGWVFNYDTHLVVGRTPFLKEKMELTADLANQASALVSQVEAELLKAEEALAKARQFEAQAQEAAALIGDLKSRIETNLVTLNGHVQAAEDAARLSEEKAAIANLPDADESAGKARQYANQAAHDAAQAAAAQNGVNQKHVEAAQTLADIQGDVSGMPPVIEDIRRTGQEVGRNAADMAREAADAAEAVRLVEERFPLDPWPEDPARYFGADYVKLITVTGTPILFRMENNGDYKPVSDDGRYTDTMTPINGGYRITTKYGYQNDYLNTGAGTSLLARKTDPNNNTITFTREGDRLTTITDSSGRETTLAYNESGYIGKITDPYGHEHQYAYANDNLAAYTDPAGHVWRYGYSEDRHLVSRSDPEGGVYQFFYDHRGRVTKEIDKEGYTFTYDYDPENRTTTMTDRRGLTTTYHYNASHRVEREVYADGTQRLFTYDERNNRTSVTNENGETTSFTYDAMNNITSRTDALGNVTRYTYEPDFNRMTNRTDALGETREFSYDANGNRIRIVREDGAAREIAYNSRGLAVSVTDENGHTTRLTYNPYGQVAEVIFPDGARRLYDADIMGRLLSVTDENGHTTDVEYTPLGRVERVVDPLGGETNVVYDAMARPVEITNANGNTWFYAFTPRSNLAQITDPLGNTMAYTYDGSNNRVQKLYPNRTGVDYTYDARNRLVEKRTFPGGRETRYAYDAAGRRTSVEDANGHVTLFERDALGRLVVRTDANGHSIQYDYDALGSLLRVVDPNGNPMTYTFDERRRMASETNAIGAATLFSYDPRGNLAAKQKPDGSRIQYAYDTRNRLVEVAYPDGTAKTYAYDAVGNLVEAAGDDTTETRQYDAGNRLIETTDSHTGKRIAYTYDLAGNRLSMTDPENGRHQYRYNDSNRLTAFVDPEGLVTTYAYDEMSRVIQASFPNGTETRWNFNSDNRLASVISESDAKGITSAFAYTYDNVGNRLSMTEEDGYITTYQYDNIYQLTAVDYPDRPRGGGDDDDDDGDDDDGDDDNKPAAGLPDMVTYTYDPAGNRLQQTRDAEVTDYQYNEANQMLSAGETQYGYDANGNRVSKSEGRHLTRYQYNYDNLLSELIDEKGRATTTYTYDAFMRRTAKETIKRGDDDDDDDDDDDRSRKETRFLYDGLRVLQEMSGSSQKHIAAYYRANGRMVARQEYKARDSRYKKRSQKKRLYYEHDGLGSVAGLTNHRGKLKTRYRYDAFGEVVEGSLKNNPYAFTGKRLDTESGLYHFHFRQYDPETGVWTTPDPISIWGGMNLYRYVRNNPINRVDFLGLEDGDATGGDAGMGGDGDGPSGPGGATGNGPEGGDGDGGGDSGAGGDNDSDAAASDPQGDGDTDSNESGNNGSNSGQASGGIPSAGELGIGNPGSYGGQNTGLSMGGSNGMGTGNDPNGEYGGQTNPCVSNPMNTILGHIARTAFTMGLRGALVGLEASRGHPVGALAGGVGGAMVGGAIGGVSGVGAVAVGGGPCR